MTKKRTAAAFIGKNAAIIQHMIDSLVAWGVRKLKEADTEEKIIDEKEPEGTAALAKKAERLGRAALGFIGTVGDTYYRTYDHLKAKSEKKK